MKSSIEPSRLEDMNEISRQCELGTRERVAITTRVHCSGTRASVQHLRTDAWPLVDVVWPECPEMKF
jgi:hypothetical protein